MMVFPADKASRAGLPDPALPGVTHRAERSDLHTSHAAVYKTGQQPAGWSSHLLQNEAGQSRSRTLQLHWLEQKGSRAADCFCGQQINSFLNRLLCELMFHILLSVFSSFYMQEKKEPRSSVLLGVAMKGVHIYQVEPPHMIDPHLEYLMNINLLCCF